MKDPAQPKINKIIFKIKMLATVEKLEYTMWPGTGTSQERRKDEGCSLKQGRAKSEPEERKVSNTGHGTGEGGSQTVTSLANSIQIT